MTGQPQRREAHPLDVDELDPAVAGALAEAVAAGFGPRVSGRYPQAVADQVLGAWRQLLVAAGASEPTSAHGSRSRIASLSSASSWRMDEVSAEAAAGSLGVSPRWVRGLAEERGIGRKVAGRWLFTPDEVDQLRRRNAA